MAPSVEQRTRLLRDFFVGRRDTFTEQQLPGAPIAYLAIKKELSDPELMAHCRGEKTISTYLVDDKGLSPLSMLDVDSKEAPSQQIIVFTQGWLKGHGLVGLVEPSGRKGYHIWILFKARLPAAKAKRLLEALMGDWVATWNRWAREEKKAFPFEVVPKEKSQGPLLVDFEGREVRLPFMVEVNPKQAAATTKEAPGNCVKLPWGKHQITEKWTAFLDEQGAIPEDWGMGLVLRAPAVTEADLDAILQKYPVEEVRAKQRGKLITKDERSEEYNALAVEKIMEACEFLRHCGKDAADLSRNHWWSMVQILAAFGEPGAKKVHELSQAYPKYKPKETNQYIDNALKAYGKKIGPHTCQYITSELGFKCDPGCQAFSLQALSPAGLACKLATQTLVQQRTRSVTISVNKKGTQKVTVNCPRLADEIRRDYIFKAIKDTEELLVYKEGVFVPLGECIVKEQVAHRLLYLTTRNRSAEVLHYVIVNSYVPREDFDREPYILNLENGLLDLRTMEVKPHTPDYPSVTRLPVTYDADAECPRVKRFWQEVVGAENVPLIEELFGFCLDPDYELHRAFLFVGDGANGKTEAAGSLVHMADGSWKKVEDVKVGDIVISPQTDGKSLFAKVTHTHSRFAQEVYDIREKTRKRRLLYTCADNHDIPIIKRYSKRTSKDDSTPRKLERRLTVWTAKELSKHANNRSQHCSFTTTAINYNRRNSSINPYYLGLFLGDGHFTSSGTLGITNSEKVIWNDFDECYPGEFLRCTPKKGSKSSEFFITNRGKFAAQLRRLRLQGKNSSTKFIPKECLLSDIAYRQRLLAGLLDTDGFVDKNGAIYYCTKSSLLADDIEDLVFSLGGHCETRLVTKTIRARTFKGNYFELSIQFLDPISILPLKTWKRSRLKRRRIDPRHIAIEAVLTKPQMVYGFSIDSPSQWYITDHWMVTHNSTMIELLRAFLGDRNCATVPLQAFDSNRFSSSQLWGKLANLYADLPTTSIQHTGRFKMLTGGDTVQAEEKYRSPFAFKNRAKLVFSANRPPRIQNEDSFAFWRRWIIVNFPNEFTQNRADKNLLSKLTNPRELAGVLNVALAGLRRIWQAGEFTYLSTVNDVTEQYLKASNPVYAFIQERCALSEEAWTSKDNLYEAFKKFCVANKLPVLGKESFGRALSNCPEASSVKPQRRRIMADVVRGWQGIDLVPEGAGGTEGGEGVDAGAQEPPATAGPEDIPF